MEQYDYLIVGAGLFGACFAQIMTERGKKCLIIEKRERAGGNIVTEKTAGIVVHKFGAHVFHTDDKRVWEYVNRFAEFNDFTYSPLADCKGTLYSLPLNMYTFNRLWGCKTPAEARGMLAAQCADVQTAEPKNFEEKALCEVGRDLYQTLVKGSAEKQWGKDCKFLPPSLFEPSPLRFTYDNKYFPDRYQGVPIDGYSEMIDRMLDGVELRTGVDYFSDKERFDRMAKTVLYTGEIDRYFGYKHGELEYRSLKFETEVLDVEDLQGNAVVNYTEYEVPFTRIIEHKHFDKTQKTKHTVVTREYPQQYVKGGEPYYPINDEKNSELYEMYEKEAKNTPNVLFGGRLGKYKYYDMDDTVAAVFELTDGIKG